jgi:hypothetical protein
MLSSKGPLDRAFDAILGYEIRKLNTHLPKNEGDTEQAVEED